tara:strand:+ start:3900 stop:6956 length:3057 start_codon:yes stop_codon:yes gene_type:complete
MNITSSNNNNLFDDLGQIWVINLERQPEKLNRIQTQLNNLPEELKSKVHIFKALDGKKLDLENNILDGIEFDTIKDWSDPFLKTGIKVGEIGCSLSHWEIWKSIAFTPDYYNKHHIIFEDDIEINDIDDFCTRLRICLDLLNEKNKNINNSDKDSNSNVDMIYLNRKLMDKSVPELIYKHYDSTTKFNLVRKSYWTCAYLISYTGAMKLLATNFDQRIIPVDEFLPIMYGESNLYNKYHNHYAGSGTFKTVAIEPRLVKLMGNAFKYSETMRSDPYSNIKKTTNNNKFEVWGIGTHNTDGRRRFCEYCDLYNLQYRIIGDGVDFKMDMSKGPGGAQKILILRDELKRDIQENPDAKYNLIVVSDTYDVMALASEQIILDKWNKFVDKSNIILFSAEHHCWPDKNLASVYPNPPKNGYPRFLNSGGFMGRKIDLWELLKDCTISEWEDDQRFWTKLYLDQEKNENEVQPRIVLDYNSEIFQTLNGSDEYLNVNYKKSIIYNSKSCVEPCFLHGNGPNSVKLKLNQMENYLGNHWKENYGYGDFYKYTFNSLCGKNIMNAENSESFPMIFVAMFGHKAHETLMDGNKFGYPKSRMVVKMYAPNFNEMNAMMSINDFIQSGCEYYFNWEVEKVEISKKGFFQYMILRLFQKRVIAPLMKRSGTVWCNFWGAVKDSGWYARSSDYMDIAKNFKRGIWNVPYLTGIFGMRREVVDGSLGKVGFLGSDIYNGTGDLDMRFCANCRKKGIFMYVDNTENWGYLYPDGVQRVVDMNSSRALLLKNMNGNKNDKENDKENDQENDKENDQDKDVGDEITIFDYFDRREEWDLKYLHPEYRKQGRNISTVEVCPDVYVFPFFTKDFCNEMIKLAELHGNWSDGEGTDQIDSRIGTKENVPTQDIHLKQMGFRKIWEQIITDHFSKLVSTIYSPYKTKGLNIAFVVKYCPEGQKELTEHHDSSTYTLNLSLNECGVDYEGGGCRFVRYGVDHTGQKPGYIAIHPGKLTHYHKGLETTKGTRYILVSFVN